MKERYLGRCYVCGERTQIRNIDIYVIGSEGLNICHEDEMKMVEWLQKQCHQNMDLKKAAFLANRAKEKYEHERAAASNDPHLETI